MVLCNQVSTATSSRLKHFLPCCVTTHVSKAESQGHGQKKSVGASARAVIQDEPAVTKELCQAGCVQDLTVPVASLCPIPMLEQQNDTAHHSPALKMTSKLKSFTTSISLDFLFCHVRLGFKQEVTKYHYSTKAAYFLKQMSHVGIHTSPVMSV